MILNEATKKQKFLDGLNEDIALYILSASHFTYQSARDAALDVERQNLYMD